MHTYFWIDILKKSNLDFCLGVPYCIKQTDSTFHGLSFVKLRCTKVDKNCFTFMDHE